MNIRTLLLLTAIFTFHTPTFGVEFEMKEKIVYSKVGDRELLLDAFLPKVERKCPAVLVVHGGAWRGGNRKQLRGYARALAADGMACFAIDYRLAPKHKFPAQIEDCRAALKWVRSNATKYNVDENRIGAIGYSAGGHLVCLLGTTGEAPSDSNGDVDSRLQVVAAGGAPTDFRWFPDNGAWAEYWMGGDLSEEPEKFKAASCVPFVDKLDPPTFFFNGTDDKVVPLAWTEGCFKAMKDAGVKTVLHKIEGAGHLQAAADAQALGKAYGFLKTHLVGEAKAGAATTSNP